MEEFGQTEAWRELRSRYLESLAQDANWLEVWHLLTENDWYQAQLARCAGSVVASGGVPREWADDVRQNALFLLGRRLRKSIDLGYDIERPDYQFVGWMRTIIFRQCREALRSMRCRHAHTQTVHEEQPRDAQNALDIKMDVRRALDRLGQPARTILELCGKGFSIPEIADLLNLTYWQVQHARAGGLEQLKRHLGPGYEDPPATS